MNWRSIQLVCVGFFLTLLLTLAMGCQGVQRSLEITSQPSGALVHVNDVEVGRTPVSVPFTHYGTYDVRLVAEGHRPLWTQGEAKAPLWDLPGPDLVAEAVGGESRVAWHFELEPMPEQNEQVLLENARQMRAQLHGQAQGESRGQSAEADGVIE